MSDFSPADAALEGFRFGREHPAGLAIWTLLFFVASLISGYLLIRSGAASAAADFAELAAQPAQEPTEAAQVMQRFFPGMFLAMLPLMVVQIFVQAAILRIALKPHEGRAYLGLGPDELRVFGATLLIMLLTGLAAVALTLVSTLLTLGNVALGILVLLAGMAAILVLLGTRLSLLYPVAVAEGAVSIGESWRLTRGRFGRVFATLLLSFVFLLIVWLLGSVVAYAIRAAAGLAAAEAEITMATLFHPAELAAGAVEALLQSLGIVLTTAPLAAMYKAIRGDRRADVF